MRSEARAQALMEKLANVLNDVIFDLPYNSVSQFYEYFGDGPTAPEFGGSCPWQSLEAGRRAQSRLAGSARVYYCSDVRHIAAICETDEEIYMLNPYLLHREPVRFELDDPAADQGISTVTVDALPVRRAASGTPVGGKLRASFDRGKRTLRFEYTRFSPTRQHRVLSRYFKLRLDDPLEEMPPPRDLVRELLVHPEQNNLGIRAANREREQLEELVYPLPFPPGREPQRTDLLARDNQGIIYRWEDGKPFSEVVDRLADTVGHSADDVIEFVLGGARIYKEVAPSGLEYPPYNKGDE